MSVEQIAEKKKQASLIENQVQLVLRKYSLTPEELAEASKDISDVILTSWDLKLSNMDYAGTWFDPQRLVE